MRSPTGLSIGLLTLVAASTVSGQAPARSVSVDALINRDYPPRLVLLTPLQRAEAVAQLLALQPRAEKALSQEVAFLLASLGHDYNTNRARLLGVLDRCGTDAPGECDENTAALVIGLHAGGHADVLKALFAVGARRPDGALAELLGTFFIEVLRRTPKAFLDSIKLIDVRSQQNVCHLAGTADSGGAASDALTKLANQLRKVGGNVALRCLHQIEVANER